MPLRTDRRRLLAALAAGLLGRPVRAQTRGDAPMTHLVLLGDSVFDNAPYVAPGREVIAQLRPLLPQGARATLLARDGAVLAGVREQAARVPADATHLFVSAGGNDGLGWTGVFGESAGTVGAALGRLAQVRAEFAARYAAMLGAVLALGRPTAVCTIYDVRFPDPAFRAAAHAALALLNDVITREAGRRRLPVLDLRTLLDEDADFANPIEPSAQGGAKLARAILQVAQDPAFGANRAWLLGGPDASSSDADGPPAPPVPG